MFWKKQAPMHLAAVLLAVLLAKCVHGQSLVVTTGPPTTGELSSNICIDNTTLRTYFPSGINLGTTELVGTADLILPSKAEVTITTPNVAADVTTGNGIQIRAGASAATNANGGSMVVSAGPSAGTGYSYAVIGADSAGSGSLQYFLFATGRNSNAASPGWLAGVWLGGNVNLQSAIELPVVAGQNDDVDLLQQNSTGIDSTVYTIPNSIGAAFSISGLCLGGAAPAIRGALVVLRNNSVYDMTIMDESTASVDGCRIQTNTDADRSTSGKGSVVLYYGDEQRWQVLSFDP